MKKIPIIAILALLMIFGCTKDDVTNTEDSNVFEEGNLSSVNRERKNNPNNGVSSIWFFGTSKENDNFRENCLPDELKLLNQGYFNGKIVGYGKINTSLSNFEFTSCEELPSDLPPIQGYDPQMYTVEALGTLALGSRDYCNVTIIGNIYTFYSVDYGYYSGSFIGNAIFSSGAGKLKDFDNKIFAIYSNNKSDALGLNLEAGTISLYIKDGQ